MSSERIAWIGLGNIGRGMSRNIAHKGPQSSPLIVYNRTASKASTFAESLGPNKATVAQSLSDAVRASTISFICVGDDAALDQIITTLLSDSSLDLTSKLIVDCSTVHPDTSRRIHTALTQRSAAFVACPVFGAPNAADAGQMIVVPAGSAASIARLTPFFDGVTAKATLDMPGDDVGAATTLKILGNTFILNTVESIAEGLVAAEKSGLGVQAYRNWVHTFLPGPFAKYADRMIEGDYWRRGEPLFAVDLARKDLGHAADVAGQAGVRLRSVEVTDEYLKRVKAEKGEKGDLAGVYGAIRQESGLPYEN
ncbi:oxidoreductase [Aspergillus steynii IBT 23096]|uniref:Oxidoreductase n=1 Tax=Aspergillus steynii IBT 23096 TaxID=1392250 RepID=A0A2I2G4W8_9EURO|nr:oxidoreductase [Aspergillus steynii IBT 23096]PLB47925.1 oxidoreductase [Aspergillus steynii IBT 23096]